MMLNINKWGIKYDILSLWYYSAGDWTPVSQIIGEHSNHYANIYIYIYIGVCVCVRARARVC